MTMNLKGAIIGAYGNAAKFSRKVGWSERKARYIVSGRQKPSMEDVLTICKALRLKDPSEIVSLFLPEVFTM